MARPATRADLQDLGFNPVVSSPEDFERLVQADIGRFRALTASMGLHAD